MRVINILVINNGIPEEIISHGIYDEQLSGEVVEETEKLFIEKVKENWKSINPITEEDIEEILDNGNWDNLCGYDIYMIWSDLEEY